MDKTHPYYAIYLNEDGSLNQIDESKAIHTNCYAYRPNRKSEMWRWIDHRGWSCYIGRDSIPKATEMAALLLS